MLYLASDTLSRLPGALGDGTTINTIRKATVAYPTIKRLFDPHCSRYDPSKALENPCVDVIKRALKHRVRGFPNLC